MRIDARPTFESTAIRSPRLRATGFVRKASIQLRAVCRLHKLGRSLSNHLTSGESRIVGVEKVRSRATDGDIATSAFRHP
jgi:hypothetical protein